MPWESHFFSKRGPCPLLRNKTHLQPEGPPGGVLLFPSRLPQRRKVSTSMACRRVIGKPRRGSGVLFCLFLVESDGGRQEPRRREVLAALVLHFLFPLVVSAASGRAGLVTPPLPVLLGEERREGGQQGPGLSRAMTFPPHTLQPGERPPCPRSAPPSPAWGGCCPAVCGRCPRPRPLPPGLLFLFHINAPHPPFQLPFKFSS